MQELIAVVQFVGNYIGALKKALDNTALLLPGLARQEIENQAKNKLSTSRDEYLSALQIKMENYVLVMELDEKNWLACAVEKGASAWDMNNPPNGKGHLKSPKAKISKDGYRYMHVPIGKEAGGKPGPSEKSKEIQKKINEVMKRPTFKNDRMGNIINRLHTRLGDRFIPGIFPGGQVFQTQQIDTGKDEDISGLYRTRAFSSSEEYYQKMSSKKGMPQWHLVMFRTISENPIAKHWMHPGITGVEILKSTEAWLWGATQRLFEEQIKRELQNIGVNT